MTDFSEFGFSKPTLSVLKEVSYEQPTEIQEKTIPLILAGADVMASAQTGSGKTAAYALPIIECLQDPENKPRALVLVPTRELAIQVEEQFRLFAKYWKLQTVTLYGGTGYDAQISALKKGVDVIVATPGRLLDLIEKRCVDLGKIEMLILDEADRMLDMGFMPQVRRVISKISAERQTLMFSATINSQVEWIAAEFMHNPVTVRANKQHIEPVEIDQRIYHVNEFGKDALLVQLIKDLEMQSVLVFTQTRRKASWVTSRLRAADVPAEEIHGDIAQNQREKTLARYRKGAFAVLVATDVAARGLDIPSISHVVNYDLPEAPEDYVHRIGRTGRAGRAGIAISFVSEGESYLVRDIEKVIGRVLDPASQIQKTTAARRLRLTPRRRVV